MKTNRVLISWMKEWDITVKKKQMVPRDLKDSAVSAHF
jgi:hypothetical protein